MKNIYNNVLEQIGNTKMVYLNNIKKKYNLNCSLIAKIESSNPSGSIKDRIAYYIISQAIKNKTIDKNSIIVEATSGNTGISLACICAIYSLKAVIVMPENMSKERRSLMKAFGAEIILTPSSQGMKGAIEEANNFCKTNKNAFYINQFENIYNSEAHYNTTALEIWEDTEGEIDAFVAGIGTGGTISGVGKFLKEQNQNVLLIGVEPKESAFLTTGVAGSHNIQGIGAGFAPITLNQNIIDKIVTITTEDAIMFAQELAKKEGIFSGISSGASLGAAVAVAATHKNLKNIVIMLPDSGFKYLSTDLVS